MKHIASILLLALGMAAQAAYAAPAKDLPLDDTGCIARPLTVKRGETYHFRNTAGNVVLTIRPVSPDIVVKGPNGKRIALEKGTDIENGDGFSFADLDRKGRYSKHHAKAACTLETQSAGCFFIVDENCNDTALARLDVLPVCTPCGSPPCLIFILIHYIFRAVSSIMRRHFVCQAVRLRGFGGLRLLPCIKQTQLRLLQIQRVLQFGHRIVQRGQQVFLQGHADFQLGDAAFLIAHHSTSAAIQPAINRGML